MTKGNTATCYDWRQIKPTSHSGIPILWHQNVLFWRYLKHISTDSMSEKRTVGGHSILWPLSLIAAVHSKMISDLTVQTPDSQHHDWHAIKRHPFNVLLANNGTSSDGSARGWQAQLTCFFLNRMDGSGFFTHDLRPLRCGIPYSPVFTVFSSICMSQVS